MQPELSRILLFWQYAELRTKVALGWRGLPRPEAAKLCLLPDVERAFSEAHRQNSTNICLSSVVIFLTRKIQPRYGGSKALIDRRQFAARLPDKWIGSALGSDFCRRAVAGKNGDVVPEGKQFSPDPGYEHIHIAAGQITSPDTAGEKDVAANE